MAWEQRGNRTYYYRKRREGSQVISEYVGTGEAVALIAQLEGIYRDKTETKRQEQKLMRSQADAIDRDLSEVCNLIRLLTDATLAANGFHKHKGQWRRRRNDNEGQTNNEDRTNAHGRVIRDYNVRD